MDEHILPENTPLPLLKLLLEDKATNEKTDNSEKQKGDETIKQRLRNAPFAKFKNYNKNSNKVQENQKKGEKDTTEKKGETDTTEKKEPEKPKEQNRFISLGKTHNFKMLQSIPKKKKVMAAFTSTLASSLFDNSSVQKEVFNYRNFKKMGASSLT
jgi:aspartokinase